MNDPTRDDDLAVFEVCYLDDRGAVSAMHEMSRAEAFRVGLADLGGVEVGDRVHYRAVEIDRVVSVAREEVARWGATIAYLNQERIGEGDAYSLWAACSDWDDVSAG